MRFNPFLYNDHGNMVELYVGGCETVDAIRLFDNNESFSVDCLGATLYKDFGWATESDIPIIKTVGEFVNFLETEGDIEIIEFEAQIGDIAKISTHDDGECNFRFGSKKECISKLKYLLPKQYTDMFINKLMNNQGVYLELLQDGRVLQYNNFDEYTDKIT
ncbi:hypothetical protein KCM76_24620 [Zooshikella marina]|uniref:hypothetical protein n=1 Tax=Zooshikella ganghwensis TaxID=202772 RepID=UPI001BAE6F1A|nr:hypothetical protein [Zooshikella ganghwensis]MBU2709203.1 hypothetical protein [Zooshikella ganghwensis]